MFVQYKAQYDLVDHTASAGPSRRTTRRAHTERLQVLTAHGPSSPATPSKQSRHTDDAPNAAFWDIKAEVKSKSKGQLFHVPNSPSAHAGRKGKGKASDAPSVTPSKGKAAKGTSILDATPVRVQSQSRANGHAHPPPRKKRRITEQGSAVDISAPKHVLRSAASMPKLAGTTAPASPALARRNANSIAPAHDGIQPVPSPVKHPIPRVKLIVRRPPTILTNPLQKPRPSSFGGSLDALLSSFTIRGGREVTVEELEAEIGSELALWRRVDRLRRQGRMLDRSPYAFQGPPPQDAWARVVAEIERAGSRPRFVDGQEMAANVAGKVRKYWEGENKAEEARLRSLARSTLRMVVAQWKKAVYVRFSILFWAIIPLIDIVSPHSTFARKRVRSGRPRNADVDRSI